MRANKEIGHGRKFVHEKRDKYGTHLIIQ